MSEAADRLARTRLAIIEHIAGRERGYERHEETDDVRAAARAAAGYAPDEPDADYEPPPRLRPGSGWIGRFQHAARVWWRHHPAQMAVEIASPVLHSYARQNPGQLVAIAAATGALVVFARPWKLISVTTLLVAVFKSSQLSTLILSALSAADFERDNQRPE